jgi:uncharacterized protein YggT (Ycf19 family)
MGIFIDIVIFFLRVYIGIIIIRVIMSWFRMNMTGFWSRLNKFLFDTTEPFLIIFRKIIPLLRTGRAYIDLSYIVAILVIEILIIMLQYTSIRFM